MSGWQHVAAIITAGGRGVRIGDVPKQFLELNGKPILEHTLENFKTTGLLDEVVLVVPADSVTQVEQDYKRFDGWLTRVVAGVLNDRTPLATGWMPWVRKPISCWFTTGSARL